MWTPHDVNMALVVPPNTANFVLNTHCDPACTKYFPSEGIEIFNVLLHSHVAGNKFNNATIYGFIGSFS